MKKKTLNRKARTRCTIDRRRKKKKGELSTNQNKRGQSVRASKNENRCDMKIRFFYNEDYDSWHLHTNSNFEHSIKESEESQTLNKCELHEEQLTSEIFCTIMVLRLL